MKSIKKQLKSECGDLKLLSKIELRMFGGTAKDFTSKFMPSEECFRNSKEI